MYLVEAALRPLETRDGEQTSDMIRNLFYGKAKQILTYVDVNTSQSVRKVQEEEFSHVIVDAAEGKDLYDGLDEYFFAEKVENFAGGREAVREVTVSSFPPILQIQVQVIRRIRAFFAWMNTRVLTFVLDSASNLIEQRPISINPMHLCNLTRSFT